jgi:hypothetical protein
MSAKLKLMYSDAAAYMIKTAASLQAFYPEIHHVLCVVYGLHRVAEQIRQQFPEVNDVISKVKKVFLKVPLRVQLHRETLPGLPLPPEPVLAR